VTVLASAIAVAAMLSLGVLQTGCSDANSTVGAEDVRDPGHSEVSAGDISYPELEGLSFVREGSIWFVESGVARPVVPNAAPWSLRTSRSGDALTWISLSGGDGRVMGALKADWRPEAIWETGYGSLLTEAVHDDVTDTLWFMASGELTATLGVVERARGNAETLLALPVDVGPSFCVAYDDSRLFVVSATQRPATLLGLEDESRASVLFEAASLFTPRCSPDGTRVAVTGSQGTGGDVGLWVVGTSGEATVEIEAGPGAPTDPVWSPDGGRVAFRDAGTGTIWVASAGETTATDTGLPVDEGGLAW
jgi:hypothetical protein